MLSGVQTINLLSKHFKFPKKRQRLWQLILFPWKWASKRS